MRIIAILAAYNEQRFIGVCLEHLIAHGVEAYLIDNESTDQTVAIAEQYLGHGLIGIETLSRVGGLHRWPAILERKEKLAASLDADWFMHVDPDEMRLPPTSDRTLAEALAEVDAQGYNAVNFQEFTFVPTQEAPDHDHPDFMQTMKWYYPFARHFPYRVNAWKRQPGPVSLDSGGHRVRFPGLCIYPEPFKMKHYQFLSLEQARITYLEKKKYPADEVKKGIWRHWLVEERMQLPPESDLNLFTSNDELSLAKPRLSHVMADWALPKMDRKMPGRSSSGPGGRESGMSSPARTPVAGQLLVAGFHRSGTSLTADLVRRSGVFLGSDLIPKNRSQPRGHFEDRQVRRLHDEVLAANGLNWQVGGLSLPAVGAEHRRRMASMVQQREEGWRLWGFKDPRACLFLDTWKALLPDARVLVVYRHFAETTHSLHRRAAHGLLDGIGNQEDHRRFLEVPDLALRMWIAHNKALVDFAEAHPEDVLAVSFDMLRRGFPLIEALNRYWGLALAETPTWDVFDTNSPVKPLGRQLVSEDDLVEDTLGIWEALEELGRRTGELTGLPVEANERPTEGAFYVPTDAYRAEIGREFSTLEASLAMARLEEAKRSNARLKKRLAAAQGVRTGPAANGSGTPPGEVRRLQEADKDLRLLVERMSGSTAAPLLRLKPEFVELERKYLG